MKTRTRNETSDGIRETDRETATDGDGARGTKTEGDGAERGSLTLRYLSLHKSSYVSINCVVLVYSLSWF